jgi:uncharacterized membrane protein YkvA (DUF1232 family)
METDRQKEVSLARSNRGWASAAWARWKQRVKQLKLETWTVYLAYRDPRTPWYARLFAVFVVGYALSPIDLVPDFVPVLGYLDDLILVPLGLALALKMIPQTVLDECREKARLELGQSKLSSWQAGALVILTWLLLGLVAVVLVVRWVGR